MNYENMSDFEINVAVAVAEGVEISSDSCGSSVGIVRRSIGCLPNYLHVDYCSNPSDAWPIITENFISIDQHYNGSYIRVWGFCDAGLISMQCLRKDVLRTTMVVFLKMMEANRG